MCQEAQHLWTTEQRSHALCLISEVADSLVNDHTGSNGMSEFDHSETGSTDLNQPLRSLILQRRADLVDSMIKMSQQACIFRVEFQCAECPARFPTFSQVLSHAQQRACYPREGVEGAASDLPSPAAGEGGAAQRSTTPQACRVMLALAAAEVSHLLEDQIPGLVSKYPSTFRIRARST